MPYKRRLGTRADLGSVTADTFSDEVDLSSSTHCLVYVHKSGIDASFDIEVWFSPTDPGETADWYQFWQSNFVASPGTVVEGMLEIRYDSTALTGPWDGQVLPSPPTYSYVGSPGYELSYSVSPRRVKFKPAETCSIVVEGYRSIG